MSRYASVVLDVDSTLSAIEGIQWLAKRCDEEVRRRIAAQTEAAMRGDIDLESVYAERLAVVRPTRAEIAALGAAYVDAISPGAVEAIAAMRAAGVRVVVVSGGLRQAVVPLAEHAGIPESDVHAVSLRFSSEGSYAGFDTSSPLYRSGGKPRCVASLALPSPVIAIGDGMTDAELRGTVSSFVAYTGFARHERVVAAADSVISSFAELPPLVLA